jgi:predicted RNA binding protein YcfA (HicA-like mRNA interferase family)
MKVREILRILYDDGWYIDTHSSTGHRQLEHPDKEGKVTVSGKPGKELKKGHPQLNS